MLSVNIQKKLGKFKLCARFEAKDNVMGILGPSGCGKSMTLRCIAGIEKPDSGRIILDDNVLFDSEKSINLAPQQRKVGYLFQNYALFPNMNVEKNILCGLYHERNRSLRRQSLQEMLCFMQLEGLEKHKPSQLSGGQQQRSALARILVNKPRLLMLDEPFSALDTHLRGQLRSQVKQLLEQYDGATLLVTHDKKEISDLCGCVAFMEQGSLMKVQNTTTIAELLDICAGSVAAFVGCGGKTSMIELVSDILNNKRVFISPTTKMFPLQRRECFGVMNDRDGKMEALPKHILAELIQYYDIALLKADGSRSLPCKGWIENEPVVPDFCTHTVGIVTMDALGVAATENVVHRLPEFLALTGLKEGEIITEQAIESMVCAPQGMFKNSRGKRYLVVNKADSDAGADIAREFLRKIKEKYPNRFERLIYGSVKMDTWQDA